MQWNGGWGEWGSTRSRAVPWVRFLQRSARGIDAIHPIRKVAGVVSQPNKLASAAAGQSSVGCRCRCRCRRHARTSAVEVVSALACAVRFVYACTIHAGRASASIELAQSVLRQIMSAIIGCLREHRMSPRQTDAFHSF